MWTVIKSTKNRNPTKRLGKVDSVTGRIDNINKTLENRNITITKGVKVRIGHLEHKNTIITNKSLDSLQDLLTGPQLSIKSVDF